MRAVEDNECLEKEAVSTASQKPGLRIAHARPDGLFARSVRAPLLFVDDTGEEFYLEEWSIDAVRRPKGLRSGPHTGTIILNFQGFNISFSVKLIEGAEPTKLTFAGLDRRQTEILRELYSGIQSGRMSAVGDTIRALDLPVDPVPMSQTDSDLEFERRPLSRWIRATIAVFIYLVLSVLVFGSLGYFLWSKTNFLAAEGSQVVATEDGIVTAGWLPEERVSAVWIGMDATVTANVDGTRFTLPATVTGLTVSTPTPDSIEPVIRVTTALDAADRSAPDLRVGQPVEITLDRELSERAAAWLKR